MEHLHDSLSLCQIGLQENPRADLWRSGDDPETSHLSPIAEEYGATSDQLLELPYKLTSQISLSKFRRITGYKCTRFLNRNTVVVPARDARGVITSLTTWDGQWLREPCLHDSGHQGAFLGVHLVDRPIEADLLTLDLESVRGRYQGVCRQRDLDSFPAPDRGKDSFPFEKGSCGMKRRPLAIERVNSPSRCASRLNNSWRRRGQ
jgi:hypothetical protein